jgi:hypothetical protein
MSGGTAKQKVLEAIERGLIELDMGQRIDHAEAKRRLLR